jgi:hypothetical protein
MNYPDVISDNITFKEATKSRKAIQYGLDNLPTEDHLSNMILVAENVFQPVREHFDVAIGITSFYRTSEVNIKIGGAKRSQHLKGQAIDMDADMYDKYIIVAHDVPKVLLTNKMIFDWIVENVEFDTIIWEFGDVNNPAWIHVSYVAGNNRKRKLRAYVDKDGETHYDNY